MAQPVPFDALLGASKTGLAIGATIYELDGSTSFAAFSTSGWYEAPAGSGGWHHPGLSLPDAGGVVAVGIAATGYLRIAVAAAPAAAPTAADIDTQLSNTHGNGAWATATGFATPTNVSDAQTAITNAIAALNNLSSAQAQSAATAALNSYDPPTKAELDTAQVAIIAAIPGTTAIVDAIKAYAVEAGVTFNDALRIILAANGGGYLANDPNDPTEIIYYAQDGTTPRLTFALAATTRTVA